MQVSISDGWRQAFPDAHVGVLLVGFDCETLKGYSISDYDMHFMKERAEFDADAWQQYPPDWWPDAPESQVSDLYRNELFRVRCWFWHRPVANK